MSEQVVDRAFAERFMRAVDDPMAYGVYFLFHDWWKEAPEHAIQAYLDELRTIPESAEVLRERFIADPLNLDELAACAPGTLGHGYHQFVVANNLEANLGRNYRDFNAELTQKGALDRLPEDMSYMMVRGFQIHDFLHVLTGYDSSPLGELSLAAFYLAQMRFPYHAMRMAVTLAHAAFVRPEITVQAMDAIVDGWAYGRRAKNLNFERWEEEIHTPLSVLQARMGLVRETAVAA